jgi:serine/threonine-protein kinase
VAALAATLGTPTRERSRVEVSRGTADEEAYELYLKGHYYWTQRGGDNLMRAIGYFRRAIGRDPTFARAYAGLAMAYEVLPNFVAGPADSLLDDAEAAAKKAIALDSTLADAHLALGNVLEVHHLQFREAQAHYRAAAIAEPSNATAHHWWGASLLNLGRTDEAVAELARAKQDDPLLKSAVSLYADALVFDQHFAEAKATAREVLSIDSTFHYGLLTLGMAQAFGAEPDSAVVTLERATRFHPEDSRMWGALLFADALAGRWAEAARIRQRLHQPGADEFDGIQAAFADLVFGDREPLVRILTSDTGIKRYVTAGGVIGCNPFLHPLWSDARFRDKMRSLGVPACALARPWPIRRPPGATTG